MLRVTRAFVFMALLLALSGQLFAQQTPPTDVMARIREEGLNHSQLMPTLSYLTDVIGPRLTGSPSMKRANEWTRDKLTSLGLQNAHLEAWGPFGRGWSLERFSAQVVSPSNIPLIAFPKAWSPGLKGTYTGEVVYVDATDEAGLQKYKGHLKGAIVLNSPARDAKAHFDPTARRYTDDQLQTMANAVPGERGGPRGGGPRGGGPRNFGADQRAQLQFGPRKLAFFRDEGVALILDVSNSGDSGTLFVQSATVIPPTASRTAAATGSPAPAPAGAPGEQPGAGTGAAQPGAPGNAFPRRMSPWDKSTPATIPQVVVAKEHYNRLVRMAQQGVSLKMAVELAVKFYDQDLMAYNTIAEIPGTDLKDQVVMLGAHMDSWHSGTGATDNAAGCAVCIEAVRILKALNLQPRRTIRIALWSGEEEGLFGSRAYVTQHLASRETPSAGAGGPGGQGAGAGALVRKPEYDKISAYYNLDNGTGKIRGVYLQSNEALRPIFNDWIAPFKDLGVTTLTINNTGSTDHVSFDSVGIPGIQFIQDQIDYETLTHHSNQDVYDHIQADDLKQAAILMAAFVYNTAMRDEMLPRKPVQERAARPTP